jgi:hypothetical protein
MKKYAAAEVMFTTCPEPRSIIGASSARVSSKAAR